MWKKERFLIGSYIRFTFNDCFEIVHIVTVIQVGFVIAHYFVTTGAQMPWVPSIPSSVMCSSATGVVLMC